MAATGGSTSRAGRQDGARVLLRDKTARNTSRARRQREGWSCTERVVSSLPRLLLSGFQGLAALPERASVFQAETTNGTSLKRLHEPETQELEDVLLKNSGASPTVVKHFSVSSRRQHEGMCCSVILYSKKMDKIITGPRTLGFHRSPLVPRSDMTCIGMKSMEFFGECTSRGRACWRVRAAILTPGRPLH